MLLSFLLLHAFLLLLAVLMSCFPVVGGVVDVANFPADPLQCVLLNMLALLILLYYYYLNILCSRLSKKYEDL